jgi:hypothetical protein
VRTYIFFNRRTGEILSTHREMALTGDTLSVPREELLSGDVGRLLADRIDTEDLDVLEADQNSHLLRRAFSQDDETELYVDVRKRILSEKERGGKAER